MKFHPLSNSIVLEFWGSPPPSPHRGRAMISNDPVFAMVPAYFVRVVPPPTSVGSGCGNGFSGSARLTPCSPSSLTRQTGSPTEGLHFSWKNNELDCVNFFEQNNLGRSSAASQVIRSGGILSSSLRYWQIVQVKVCTVKVRSLKNNRQCLVSDDVFQSVLDLM